MRYSYFENFSAHKDTKIQKRFRRMRFRWRKFRNPKVIRNRGIYLNLDVPGISPLVYEYLLKDHYERQEFGILNSVLTSDDVVMEIGSGIGFISIFAAGRVGPEHVHAYEANPALIPIIKENYALNGVHPELSNCVLENSDTGGFRSFYPVEDFWASSTLNVKNQTSEIKVPAVSFEKELQRIQPTFLVADIEGGEKELFDEVSLVGVRCALIEMHPTIIGEIAVKKIVEHLAICGLIENKEISAGDVLFFEKRSA